jgi:hypothetical protein
VQLARRVVREDGQDLWASVSEYSTRGCNLDCNLTLGEIVSVEMSDAAILIGEVGALISGRSAISFIGLAAH